MLIKYYNQKINIKHYLIYLKFILNQFNNLKVTPKLKFRFNFQFLKYLNIKVNY